MAQKIGALRRGIFDSKRAAMVNGLKQMANRAAAGYKLPGNLLRLCKQCARNRHVRLVWLANGDRSLYCEPDQKAVDLLA
ncbi:MULTISPECIES: hypothetical protein [unclassified Mesorhizobium]|jgi:hypothetical protein|uniref:hypothetical protein n=1 Tax=unclassified Mesorhizobium TaxID=325217 RepID=UPI000FDAC5A0|nr:MULTISPECIES: hypothetical protein [unclassified Mesorhizobium]TGQ05794.1 hypothetical protein EN862_030655 [Mesorhizobium sp. M2E.F.Ca.ET.219.01.1.1]TGT71700.1 hypothetical protein EN809_016025 [Mesorhizobium sp. M2E.F.Ca.ET.166.01.1.1]TGV99584.1 hypothetical protein EN797_025225 [Mesorhizobium sp. M2E.F.Ca.ET.154.01.1.1]